MPPAKFYPIKFQKAIIDRSDWVLYLVLVNWHTDKIGDAVMAAPTKEFRTFVEKTLNDYLTKEKLPDGEIATPIMNLADDHLSGREIVLKAGDYYALQNYFRGMKGKTVRTASAAATRKKAATGR